MTRMELSPRSMVGTLGMEFFCYHRDRPDSAALRDELPEEHWSSMDRYPAEMIARGPTFDRGSDTATGRGCGFHARMNNFRVRSNIR
jgi:hypothetical protein